MDKYVKKKSLHANCNLMRVFMQFCIRRIVYTQKNYKKSRAYTQWQEVDYSKANSVPRSRKVTKKSILLYFTILDINFYKRIHVIFMKFSP